MSDEKQKFSIVGDLPMVAGQKPDENGFVYLNESEALYERAIGRILPVEAVAEKRGKSSGASQDSA